MLQNKGLLDLKLKVQLFMFYKNSRTAPNIHFSGFAVMSLSNLLGVLGL